MDSEFEKQLSAGVYKNIKEFSNNQNLKNIVKYLNTTKVRPEVLEIVFNLLRFYRFPLALCCSHLYAQIQKTSLQQQNLLKDKLIEIAAYVKSLLGEMQFKIFTQIQFFFKWGHAKKKYKIPILPQQKEFLQLIVQLSEQKKQLQSLIKSQISFDDKKERINTFLSKTFPDMNILQQNSIEYMKSNCADIIKQIQKQEQFPSISKQPSKKKIYKPISNEKTKSNEKPKSIERSYAVKSNAPQSNQQKSLVPSAKKQQFYVGLIPTSNQSQKLKNICCRTFFYSSQIIEYPQSLRIQYKFYNFPFRDNPNEFPGKQQKIKRTICGFLNAQGGTIYFGIKQLAESKKRIVNGFILTQGNKKLFTSTIMKLLKQVLPDVGKKCTVKYIPIKEANNTFISGRYVAKVIIQKGAKNQVYSYVHQSFENFKIQKFTFRTENQVLQISEIQRILKIFKNKLESPQRQFYPTHPYPCPEPLAGKPLYDKQQYQLYEPDQQYQRRQPPKIPKPQKLQYQKSEISVNKKSGSFDELYDQSELSQDTQFLAQKFQQPQSWKQQEQMMKKRKYMQRQSLQFLINMSVEQLNIFLKRQGINFTLSYDMKFNGGKWSFLQLQKSSDIKKLEGLQEQVITVYSRLSYKDLQEETIKLMEDIIDEYRNKWNTITRQTKDKILIFKSGKPACQFYLRTREMGIQIAFTPMI